LVGLAEVGTGGGVGTGAVAGGDRVGGGASLIVVSDGRGGGAGGVGAAGRGTGGDCAYADGITVAVTATSGNPTSRAGRRKRHAGLPVMPPY